MYTPADFPSSIRAAPAKKRRLSEHTGISSRAYDKGLPTLADSIRASSSAYSSMIDASFSNNSPRSPGVESSHSGRAARAASTARSTSSAAQRGTSAITSPVAGFSTSIVSPDPASAHSPPTKIRLVAWVMLMSCLLFGAQDSGLVRQPLRDHYGDDRQCKHDQDHDVDLRELLAEADVPEDPERKGVVGAGGECGHDHFVEREREREQPAGDQRCRDGREGDEAERLPAARSEVHRCLGQRARHAP